MFLLFTKTYLAFVSRSLTNKLENRQHLHSNDFWVLAKLTDSE